MFHHGGVPAFVYPVQFGTGHQLMELFGYFRRGYYVVLSPDKERGLVYLGEVFFHVVADGAFRY